MRLLNTSEITLEEFDGVNIPAYAILSHRWEADEVSLQDMESGKAINKRGYDKIKGCCIQAAKGGLKYAWIDTCCIDKSSSAELSQAINSMYRWYSDSQVCYTYMSDVSYPTEPDSEIAEFQRSKWFTRGWTLQELLAPSEVIFFNKFWIKLGTKASLEDTISEVTGIQHLFRFGQASVAQKMSWASKRETTRVEDMAYCLLGIFDVHMPPLYGEGENAFFRLQVEILLKNDDESIFAWEEDESESGLLTKSPASFRDCSDVRQIGVGEVRRTPCSMTNKGLQIEFVLIPMSTPYLHPVSGTKAPEKSPRISKYGSYFALLNCIRGNPLAIRLERSRGYQYYRVPSTLYTLNLDEYDGRVDFACAAMSKKGLTMLETLHVRQRIDSTPYFADGDPGHYEFVFEKPENIQHVDTFSRWNFGCSWGKGADARGVQMERMGEVLRVQMLPSLDGTWVVCIFKHIPTASFFGVMLYVDKQYLVGVSICDFSIMAAELSEKGRSLGQEIRLESQRINKPSEVRRDKPSRRRGNANQDSDDLDQRMEQIKLELQESPYQIRPDSERAANTKFMLDEMKVR